MRKYKAFLLVLPAAFVVCIFSIIHNIFSGLIIGKYTSSLRER